VETVKTREGLLTKSRRGFAILCVVAVSSICASAQTRSLELGVDVTGTHLHKIDEAPVGVGVRALVNLNPGNALDVEATKYPGKVSVLAGLKSGVRFSRFGVFGKGRAGFWHFTRTYAAADVGGVLEYYASPHVAVRIDIGDTIIFYGGAQLGTVHNFQPGIGVSYRF
jgi:hypothetical protein